MEELRIKILLMVEHAPEAVEQFAHDRDDGDLGFLATGQQGLIASLDLRAALDGYQRGHEQRQAQMAIAGAANVTWSIVLTALAGARIKPGVSDPLPGLEVGGQNEQFAQ